MSLGMKWGDWLRMPPEHRALYAAVKGHRARMNEVERSETDAAKELSAANEKRKRGRR
jgi:GrpB-like predicted nucleotidyltransferase (UPF0157 family)